MEKMKFILAAVVAVMSVSAFAQKHMVQFGTDAQTLSSLSFRSEKHSGQKSEEDKNFNFTGNYAYALTSNLQVGANFNYSIEKENNEDSENYGLLVGATWNFDTDFRKAYYVGVHAGMDWGRKSGGDENSSSEELISRATAGKRFPLSFIGLENVTYSPEVSFTSVNSTKKTDTEWSQDLSFKILQFSVFF
jgi:opacity protein-like surface antigen